MCVSGNLMQVFEDNCEDKHAVIHKHLKVLGVSVGSDKTIVNEFRFRTEQVRTKRPDECVCVWFFFAMTRPVTHNTPRRLHAVFNLLPF